MYETILDFARAFGTPFAAFVGAFIAYRFGTIQADIARRQAQTASDSALTARNKLRMDMYQERLKIYNDVMLMFATLGMKGQLTHEDEVHYLNSIGSARWVFGKDTEDFLKVTVWRAIVDYVAAQNSYDEHADTEYRAELSKAKTKYRKELLAFQDEVDHRFAEFMEFERKPLAPAVQ